MKLLFQFIAFLLVSISAIAQNPVLIQGKLVSDYSKSGVLDERFVNVVDHFENDLYQGTCEIYEIMFENYFEAQELDFVGIQDTFIVHGKGEMVDGIKAGKWIYFLLDKDLQREYKFKEVNYIKGLMEGGFNYYFTSGEIVSTGTYLHGQLDGIGKFYNTKGTLISEIEYKNNEANGKETDYYPDGRKHMEKFFVNGVIDGELRKYYPNGKVEEFQELKMGVLNGKYIYFYENGSKWVEKHYVNGLLWNVLINQDIHGKERDKGSIKDGNGTENYYTPEGKVYAVRTYLNGKMIDQKMIE